MMSLFLPWITLCQEQTCAFFLPVVDLLEGLRELGVVVVLKLDLLGGGHGGQGHDARDEDGTSRQHAEHMGEEDRKRVASVCRPRRTQHE